MSDLHTTSWRTRLSSLHPASCLLCGLSPSGRYTEPAIVKKKSSHFKYVYLCVEIRLHVTQKLYIDGTKCTYPNIPNSFCALYIKSHDIVASLGVSYIKKSGRDETPGSASLRHTFNLRKCLTAHRREVTNRVNDLCNNVFYLSINLSSLFILHLLLFLFPTSFLNYFSPPTSSFPFPYPFLAVRMLYTSSCLLLLPVLHPQHPHPHPLLHRRLSFPISSPSSHYLLIIFPIPSLLL